MKESFVFYRSFYEAILELETAEEKLELYEALCEFNFENKKPKFKNKHTEAMFKLIQPLIDSAFRRYQASVENGKRGGNPNFKKGQPNPYYQNKKITQDNLNENDNVNVNDNVNDNESERESKERDSVLSSTPSLTPTLSELRSYCYENDMSGFDYDNFYNYYEANGWINKNGTPIKNWKAKVNYWYKKDLETGKIKIDTRRRLD